MSTEAYGGVESVRYNLSPEKDAAICVFGLKGYVRLTLVTLVATPPFSTL